MVIWVIRGLRSGRATAVAQFISPVQPEQTGQSIPHDLSGRTDGRSDRRSGSIRRCDAADSVSNDEFGCVNGNHTSIACCGIASIRVSHRRSFFRTVDIVPGWGGHVVESSKVPGSPVGPIPTAQLYQPTAIRLIRSRSLTRIPSPLRTTQLDLRDSRR